MTHSDGRHHANDPEISLPAPYPCNLVGASAGEARQSRQIIADETSDQARTTDGRHFSGDAVRFMQGGERPRAHGARKAWSAEPFVSFTSFHLWSKSGKPGARKFAKYPEKWLGF
jgi:hypothetical protein